MGLCPSCVKTAPRKVAVWLFMITEQVIYICIFSNVFDTPPLNFSGRLLLKLPHTTWYATHTGFPSGHHQWRLKSDEEKKRGWRGRGENERENSVHSNPPKKAWEHQKASMFWPQSFDLSQTSKGCSSLISHHTNSAIDCTVTFATKLSDNPLTGSAYNIFLFSIKTAQPLAADSWQQAPCLPLSFLTFPHNSIGKWSKLICHSWARALIMY